MSSVSKLSSRSSSSSGFSSSSHEQFSPIFTLQTVIAIQRTDINARTFFCGEQDCRLNELRRMTGAIIDLHVVQGTRCSFERVHWTISHPKSDVRDFVVRRLNHWTQQTQLACDMAYDDGVFVQEQQEKRIKAKQAPPISVANFTGRHRTRSLTRSDMINLNRDRITGTPTTSTYKREPALAGFLGRTLLNLNSRGNDTAGLLTHQADDHADMPSSDMNQLLEQAKWAGVLSDTSDQELHENRVCFADTVSLSKLAQMLRDHELQLTSTIDEIDEVMKKNIMNVTSREHRRQVDSRDYWFHRVVLDGHIQFPVGISSNSHQARRLAFEHMRDVCLNPGGVKMKMLIGNRVKVVKGSIIQTPADDFDINATYISMGDLSCLSHSNNLH